MCDVSESYGRFGKSQWIWKISKTDQVPLRIRFESNPGRPDPETLAATGTEGPISLGPNLSPPEDFSVGGQRQAEIVASEQKTPKTRFSGFSEKTDKSDLNTPNGTRTNREILRKSMKSLPARHKIRRSTDRAPSTHQVRTWPKLSRHGPV